LRSACWSLRGLVTALLVFAVIPASASARQDRTEAAILRVMNRVRAQNHLPKLHANGALARAADAHSAAMLRSGNFSHGAVSSRLRRYTHARSFGETLAWYSSCDGGAIVNMWLNSAPHRAILLSRTFHRVGVGKRSAPAKCMVTADFAS
jgi:uncharacterized protein YkwD